MKSYTCTQANFTQNGPKSKSPAALSQQCELLHYQIPYVHLTLNINEFLLTFLLLLDLVHIISYAGLFNQQINAIHTFVKVVLH